MQELFVDLDEANIGDVLVAMKVENPELEGAFDGPRF
jgi:hypothetical protein